MTTRVPSFVHSEKLLSEKDLKNMIISKKLAVGDVIVHDHLYTIVGSPETDCGRYSSINISCQLSALFEDPIASYEKIRPFLNGYNKRMVIELYADHPCLVKYCKGLESRWYKVAVTYWRPGRDVVVYYAKNLVHSERRYRSLDFDNIEETELSDWLKELLEPRVTAYVLMKHRVEENEYIREDTMFRPHCSIEFDDGETTWVSNGTRKLYEIDESSSLFPTAWKVVQARYSADILQYKIMPTNKFMTGWPNGETRMFVRPEIQRASKYVHEIILDVSICLFAIFEAPYVILWILDELCYTKYNYGRRREHVIEGIYRSMRKIVDERQNKRIKT